MRDPFFPVDPTDDMRASLRELRRAFEAAAGALDSHLPQGRYRALAMTALEQAAMWATKSITHDQPEEKPA